MEKWDKPNRDSPAISSSRLQRTIAEYHGLLLDKTLTQHINHDEPSALDVVTTAMETVIGKRQPLRASVEG
ncbi:hypothetical protein EVAR_45089_1 [Eumeta japonica]|uniref:Uncharacterized protein n=1 Tax=Eumeta variegata TaxID=151549 RepID=A0A4C1YEF8_EUMVA|nr:hypothetical protein EVAR_45089_1 [Eumeta japonica]